MRPGDLERVESGEGIESLLDEQGFFNRPLLWNPVKELKAAGGRNVIIGVFMPSAAFDSAAQCTFRIKKADIVLQETKIVEAPNQGGMRAKPVMLMAVDTSPHGNDSYTFAINVTTAGTTTGPIHVQGWVLKTDDAQIVYNDTAVSIAAGATATVVSLATNYPAGSKVVALAYVYANISAAAAQYLIGAGNVKLKLGTAIISSNQFNLGFYSSVHPLHVSLVWGGTVASSTQTWSVEITNGSSVAINAYAIIVTFTVADVAFLDTDSVALTNGSQVTVGNLSTRLSGDVVAIGMATAENTSTANVTAFYANDVVLQVNDLATGQSANLVDWYLEQTGWHGRSGILPLFRYDTGVTNPSYQIKMTARANGINGEAKIVAFPGQVQFLSSID